MSCECPVIKEICGLWKKAGTYDDRYTLSMGNFSMFWSGVSIPIGGSIGEAERESTPAGSWILMDPQHMVQVGDSVKKQELRNIYVSQKIVSKDDNYRNIWVFCKGNV